MLHRIDDLVLYTALTNVDSFHALNWMKAQGFVEGRDFQHNHYADDSVHAGLFKTLTDWWPDGSRQHTDFPFLHYTEVHLDLKPSQYPRESLIGLKAIQDSGIVELFKVGRPDWVAATS